MMPSIHVFSSKPKTQSFCSILLEEQLLDRPVIEVQIVKILDQCGLENAIPSPNDRQRTSYVMISRGKSRFVDGEVHIPNAELRSSADWDSRRQASRRLVRPMLQVRQASRRLVRTPSAFLPAKRPVIPANSSYGGALSIAVSKMVQERCVITTKMNDNLTQNSLGTRQPRYC